MRFILALLLAASPWPEVREYQRAIEKVRSSKNASLEPVFNAALAVRRLLLDKGLIEKLSDPQFENLARDFPGIVVNRDEVLLANPDAKFFLDLARRNGSRTDVAFFEEYKATFPDSVWPVYLNQQTDVTGCVDYAGGKLIERYAGWRKFRTGFPTAYKESVAERFTEIEDAVANATCACGSRESVLDELQRFARMFPDASVAAKVRLRVDALKKSKSDIRFKCISG